MIEKVHELIEEVLRVGLKKCSNINGLKHTVTIGKMYEGLTKEILNESIPKEYNLQVISGFIKLQNGELSSQIDCMLVFGNNLE